MPWCWRGPAGRRSHSCWSWGQLLWRTCTLPPTPLAPLFHCNHGQQITTKVSTMTSYQYRAMYRLVLLPNTVTITTLLRRLLPYSVYCHVVLSPLRAITTCSYCHVVPSQRRVATRRTATLNAITTCGCHHSALSTGRIITMYCCCHVLLSQQRVIAM